MGEGTLIIGAGVIGLGIGWKLAQQGEPVTILERGVAGREASWAAAGMLAPANEEQLYGLHAWAPTSARRRIVRWAAEDRGRRTPVDGEALALLGLSGPAHRK